MLLFSGPGYVNVCLNKTNKQKQKKARTHMHLILNWVNPVLYLKKKQKNKTIQETLISWILPILTDYVFLVFPSCAVRTVDVTKLQMIRSCKYEAKAQVWSKQSDPDSFIKILWCVDVFIWKPLLFISVGTGWMMSGCTKAQHKTNKDYFESWNHAKLLQ